MIESRARSGNGGSVMMDRSNGLVIEVLKRAICREEERIERSQAEILRCKLELLELGVELPLQESEPNSGGGYER